MVLITTWSSYLQPSSDVRQPSFEAAIPRCSSKQVFLKISHIRRKISVFESLFNKVTDLNYIKKRLQHWCFLVNIVNFYEYYFYKTPLVAASMWCMI